MEEFESKTAADAAAASENEETGSATRLQFRDLGRNVLKQFVLFLSFGPGIGPVPVIPLKAKRISLCVLCWHSGPAGTRAGWITSSGNRD